MSGEERRNSILQKLIEAKSPIPGTSLAREFEVSRQVIVQDIALIRANGRDIISTNRGYVLNDTVTMAEHSRVFKVRHTAEEVEDELSLFVDFGGKVKDVFVYHKVYGVIKADMNIKSRRDIAAYMKELASGKSTLLSNVTSGYHYHTIVAEDEETLDLIQEELTKKGFLAKLQDYEPVDFWSKVQAEC